MKITCSLFLLSLAALSLTGCQTPADSARKSGRTTSKDAPATPSSAMVGAQLGRFYFPIQNIDQTWSLQAAPENQLEYKWTVNAVLKNETYNWGFSRFCSNPKTKSVGTFEQLLGSGQVDIWKKQADRTSVVSSVAGVTAQRQGDGLLIQLKDPKLLAKLLAEKPATLTFESFQSPHGWHKESVPVIYP